MSRRRSISTPLARSVGPVAPSAMASSAVMYATPLVRSIQMGLAVSRSSYSSTLEGKRSTKFFTRSKKPRGGSSEPADAEVGGHHALAADHLEHAQHVFAFAEAVEEHRHGADIEGVRAQPDQVRVDARQFVQHHAEPLRPRRDLQAQQLFHRQHVTQVVGQRAEIIDAVGERHHCW